MGDFDRITSFVSENIVTISITIGIIFLYFLSRYVIFKLITNRRKKGEFQEGRELYMRKVSNMLLILLLLTIIGASWEISIKGLSIYFASIFTVVGVALFATWSIISNITASIILFFFFPYRIGQDIKIMDGDNSVEGKIIDITLFYINIKGTDNKMYSYPNNLAIQKPIFHV